MRALAKKKLSDIHDGDYIASASVHGKDGKLHALEIHFLTPTTPEGQRPWDLRKDSVMTNAHVTGIAKVKGGTDIAVTYKGSSTDVIVDRKTVIVGPADASMADLKPGKAVVLFAEQGRGRQDQRTGRLRREERRQAADVKSAGEAARAHARRALGNQLCNIIAANAVEGGARWA